MDSLDPDDKTRVLMYAHYGPYFRFFLDDELPDPGADPADLAKKIKSSSIDVARAIKKNGFAVLKDGNPVFEFVGYTIMPGTYWGIERKFFERCVERHFLVHNVADFKPTLDALQGIDTGAGLEVSFDGTACIMAAGLPAGFKVKRIPATRS
jgi:hypothetical protein